MLCLFFFFFFYVFWLVILCFVVFIVFVFAFLICSMSDVAKPSKHIILVTMSNGLSFFFFFHNAKNWQEIWRQKKEVRLFILLFSTYFTTILKVAIMNVIVLLHCYLFYRSTLFGIWEILFISSSLLGV